MNVAKLVPAPLLSASLFALWILLARSTSAGHLVLALVLAIAVPILTTRLRPRSTRVRHPLAVARFVLNVGYDVVTSNLEVARDVVLFRWRPPRSKFVVIPLEVRDPSAVAALAIVTTIVPGTVGSELALDGSALLLHVWNVPDDAAFIARFKARYEAPLREMFE